MTSVFLRTGHNYDTDLASFESGLSCLDPSLAQQNFRDECDINTIMSRFGQGATLPENYRPPEYGDFSTLHDYHSAMNAVSQAGESFDMLPANLRSRFGNNPETFLSFIFDPLNRPEAVLLGLVPPLPSAPLSAGPPASSSLSPAPLLPSTI